MKFKTFLTIATICFFGIGCKTKMAKDYNDMIVTKQKKLSESITENEPKLRNYFATYEYDSISSISDRMIAKINSIIRDIKNKPAPKVRQGENFKKAALDYFEYMNILYTAYKNYGSQTTPEGRIVGREVIARVTTEEGLMIAQLQEAQRIFAKDNGFKIKQGNEKKSYTASPPNR